MKLNLALAVPVILFSALVTGCKPKAAGPEQAPESGAGQNAGSPVPATSPSPADDRRGKPSPSGSGSITVTKEEQEAATEVNSNATIKETLASGQSKVFRFQHDPAKDILAVNSNRLDKPGDPFEAGKAGYAVFDAQGKLVGLARVAWNDAPAVKKPAGTFYIKVVGPGELDIQLQ